MSNDLLRYLIAGFLVVHGIGHSGGYWFFAKSAISPVFAESPLRWVFTALWLVAMVVYLVAGYMLFQQQVGWRTLAVGASVLSLIVALLFIKGPPFNAFGADVIILVALLWFGWPSSDVVGA